MYCTVSDLKSYLGLSESTDDALLVSLIQDAQAVIEAETLRVFELPDADSTRYFDASTDVKNETLYLDRDLYSITSIINGDSASVSGSAYVTEPRNDKPYHAIRLKQSGAVRWTYIEDAENAIAVTGRWCYSSEPPALIQRVCKRLAAYLYRQRENANDLDRALVVGNATVLPQQLPQDIRNDLQAFKRLV